MGSGTSYLDAATIADLIAIRRDGFATTAAVKDTEPLVLARWNAMLEQDDTLPVQDVVVTYANRAEQQARGDAAMATLVDGYFEKLDPFDVETGDRFALGQMAGEIVVVLPPQMGIQRAGWVLRQGEVS